jgi:hypothetical protein
MKQRMRLPESQLFTGTYDDVGHPGGAIGRDDRSVSQSTIPTPQVASLPTHAAAESGGGR